MAEIFYEDFEGTDGVTLTQTPGNTAFSVITSTPSFDTEFKMVGNSSGMFDAAGAIRMAEARYTPDQTAIWAVFYLRILAAPSANLIIAEAHNRDLDGDPEDDDTVSQIRLNTGMTLQLRDKVTAETWTSPALSTGTWYRIEHRVAITGVSTGSHQLTIYEGDSASATVGGSASDSGSINRTGSNATYLDSYYIGVCSAGTLTVWIDDLHIDDAAFWTPAAPPAEYTPFIVHGQVNL